MGEFVAGIALRYREVYCSLEPTENAETFNALSRYKFAALSACLQAFHTFKQWTEELQANFGTGLRKIIKLIDRFVGMERDCKEYADTCRTVLLQQILGTAHLTHLLLGFLVTSDGFGWYRYLQSEWVAGMRFVSRQLIRRGVRLLQIHFQKFLGVDETVADFLWDQYLHSG
jgi:hypothetical protein